MKFPFLSLFFLTTISFGQNFSLNSITDQPSIFSKDRNVAQTQPYQQQQQQRTPPIRTNVGTPIPVLLGVIRENSGTVVFSGIMDNGTSIHIGDKVPQSGVMVVDIRVVDITMDGMKLSNNTFVKIGWNVNGQMGVGLPIGEIRSETVSAQPVQNGQGGPQQPLQGLRVGRGGQQGGPGVQGGRNGGNRGGRGNVPMVPVLPNVPISE